MAKTENAEKLEKLEKILLWAIFGKNPKYRLGGLTTAEKIELYEKLIKFIENGGQLA